MEQLKKLFNLRAASLVYALLVATSGSVSISVPEVCWLQGCGGRWCGLNFLFFLPYLYEVTK